MYLPKLKSYFGNKAYCVTLKETLKLLLLAKSESDSVLCLVATLGGCRETGTKKTAKQILKKVAKRTKKTLTNEALSNIAGTDSQTTTAAQGAFGSPTVSKRGGTKDLPRGNLSGLTVWSSNVRGLRGNHDELTQLIHISERKPDCISLCETFLNDDVLDNAICIDDYVLFRRDRPSSRFGGVAVYLKESIQFKRRFDLEHKDYEVLWLESVSKGPKLHIISVYRPPDDDDTMLNHLEEKLLTLKTHEHVLILGDFNAKHSDWYTDGPTDVHGRALFNFANTNGLFQLVKDATRRGADGKASQIDYVLTDIEDQKHAVISAPIGKSDHDLIETHVQIPIKRGACAFRYVWDYAKADWNGMRSFLADSCFFSDIEGNDVNEFWESWKLFVLQACAKFIPFRRISSRHKKNPWFNKECADAIKEKRDAHRRMLNSQGSLDTAFTEFTDKRNKAVQACRKAKQEYKRNTGLRLESEGLKDPKKWSKVVKLATGTGGQSRIPNIIQGDRVISDGRAKAHAFNKMFSSVSQVDDGGVIPPQRRYPCDTNLTCIKFRHADVVRRLQKLDVSKATGPDGISARVLKECAYELAPSLSKIFSMSFKAGQLPHEWKTSNVCPVYKKGAKTVPENYRPISLLCIVSKVMEGIISNKLRRFLFENKKIHDFQFGFRPKSSTLDALTVSTQKWEDAMDKQKEVRVVSLDISRAFDKVWHPGLIAKLEEAGVSGPLLNWLINFVSGREQCVVLDGVCSPLLSTGAGVPQGSILGPTLFLLFINDLKQVVKNEVVMFADDTTLFSVVDSKSSRADVANSLNEDLREIEKWAETWFVKFNATKTQSLLISRCQDMENHPPLYFCGSRVQEVSSIKFLGLIIDRKLSWSQQIFSLSKKAGRRAGLLKKARHVLPQRLLTMYYKQSIRPMMEQYAPIWHGSSQRDLHSLDSIQKKCLHFCGISRQNLLAERLQPLAHRRKVAGLSTFYKLQRGLVPTALNCVKPEEFISSRETRLSTSLLGRGVKIPRSRTLHHQQSYIPNYCRLWNDLPHQLTCSRKEVNLLRFKRDVNRHLLTSQGISSSFQTKSYNAHPTRR